MAPESSAPEREQAPAGLRVRPDRFPGGSRKRTFIGPVPLTARTAPDRSRPTLSERPDPSARSNRPRGNRANGVYLPATRGAGGGPPATGLVPSRAAQPAERGLVVAAADRREDPADAGGDRATPVSDPGSWDRFCARAVQRWPLVLGAALLFGAPAAVVGFGQGEERWAAEARVEVQPQTLTAGADADAAVVPAEALGVASLLQREARLLSDLAADAGLDAAVRARPPFGLVAAVRGGAPAEATEAAATLLETYTRKTRLKMPEQVALERVALDEQERALEEARSKLSAADLEVARTEAKLAGTAEPAALLAAEAEAEEAGRTADRRLRRALAIGRDPLVFFAELVRREPAAAEAVRDASGAAAAALGAAATGPRLGEALRAAAAGVAGVVAEVADHRVIEGSGEPGAGGTVLVRVSRLDAEAAEAAAAVRAAAAESAVAALERSALQSLRWEREGLRVAVESGARAIERVRVDLPGAASLAEVRAVDAPAEPAADSRPLTAGLGGLLGGLLGVLGALGWIAVDDRVRRGDERPWAARGLTILGTVPAVGGAAGGGSNAAGKPEAMTEASQRRARGEAAALADAVHAVRAMLEGRDANGRLAAGGGSSPGLARVPDADGRTFAITSSGPGSGKTGLCLGLAASLASAGERVLLVDAAWADRPSRGEGNPGGGRQTLDTAAAAMGYLHPEDEDLLRHADPDEPVGLPAFLAGADLADAAMETRVPGLSLLAAGPGTLDAGRLSGRHVRRLVEAARPLHDVTLIDTSAVSVGLDALFVAGAADGVVLVVSAGERQSAVDKAVTRLRASGATVLGTVLNRVGRPAATRATAGAGAPAAAGGWQDTGSGMFAAAVGGPAASPTPAKEARSASRAPDAPAAGPARRVVASTSPAAKPAAAPVAEELPSPSASATRRRTENTETPAPTRTTSTWPTCSPP